MSARTYPCRRTVREDSPRGEWDVERTVELAIDDIEAADLATLSDADRERALVAIAARGWILRDGVIADACPGAYSLTCSPAPEDGRWFVAVSLRAEDVWSNGWYATAEQARDAGVRAAEVHAALAGLPADRRVEALTLALAELDAHPLVAVAAAAERAKARVEDDHAFDGDDGAADAAMGEARERELRIVGPARARRQQPRASRAQKFGRIGR